MNDWRRLYGWLSQVWGLTPEQVGRLTDREVWEHYLTPWDGPKAGSEQPKPLRIVTIDRLRAEGKTTEEIRDYLRRGRELIEGKRGNGPCPKNASAEPTLNSTPRGP